jgi:hypothetical protein
MLSKVRHSSTTRVAAAMFLRYWGVELIESRAFDLDRRISELVALRDELPRLARRGRTLSPDACSPDLVCHILNPARSPAS